MSTNKREEGEGGQGEHFEMLMKINVMNYSNLPD